MCVCGGPYHSSFSIEDRELVVGVRDAFVECETNVECFELTAVHEVLHAELAARFFVRHERQMHRARETTFGHAHLGAAAQQGQQGLQVLHAHAFHILRAAASKINGQHR
jgi:hypothetical protein